MRPSSFGRDDQHQRVGRRLLGQLDDRIRALLARRGAGHADLDDLALGEQRHRAAVREQRLPVEAALDDVQLALDESLLARRGANRIRGLVDEQRLVSGHEIDRLELTGQAGSEVVAGKLHLAERDRVWRTRRQRRKTSERTVEHSNDETICAGARLIRVNVGPIMAQAARRGHRNRHAAPVAAFRCVRPQVSCVTGLPDGLVVLRRRRSSESAGRLLVRRGPRNDGSRADRRPRHSRPARHRGHAPAAAPLVHSRQPSAPAPTSTLRCRSARARRSRSPTSSH